MTQSKWFNMPRECSPPHLRSFFRNNEVIVSSNKSMIPSSAEAMIAQKEECTNDDFHN